MARRRRQEEEHENHERWLVSYADFITLLFAFFVVMYAISSVNDGKYRILSDALTSAFRNVDSAVHVNPAASSSIVPQLNPRRAQRVAEQRRERAREAATTAAQTLEPLVRAGQLRVSEGARGITIEINSNLLFESGESTLVPQAEAVLRAIGASLAQADFPVTVEGHTDNVPIGGARFASNWELSAVRAASVARLLGDAGVPLGVLSAAGYGEQRPLESNVTPEGRARNRRVAILLESMYPDARADQPPANPPKQLVGVAQTE